MKNWSLISYESVHTMAYQASETGSRIWTWIHSTLTLKILIYYIRESGPNPLGVSWYWSLKNFSGDLRLERCLRRGYGGLIQRELGVLWAHESMATSNLSPRYEPILSNGGDGLSKVVGNWRTKEGLTYRSHRLARLQVGPTGPTLQPLRSGHGVLSSGCF
jgi:hypothetical protein